MQARADGFLRQPAAAAAVLVGCLLAGVAAMASSYGVLVYLKPSAAKSFDARHDTTSVRLNATRDLYLVKSKDGESDQQLLQDIETDSAASSPTVNEPVRMNQSTASVLNQSTASVMNQSTASVLNQSTASVLNQSTASVLNQSTASVLNGATEPVLSQSTASVLNPVISTIDQSTASVLNGETDYYGTRAPKQYVQQPMVAQVAAGEEAHALATGRGAVVAIIDNGVAQFNPVLSKVLLYREGYNFYDNSPNWSAWSDLEQSTASVLNQSTASVLNSSSTPVLDQSTASVLNGCLDQSTASVLNQSTASVLNSAAEKFLKQLIGYIISNCEPDFGHGTAVAGMIHLVAPEAKILPIKAFGPDGTAPASAIYQSITYAIDHGANVINMSFSAQSLPQDVQNAVQEAVGDGIIIAAAAGNYGYGASPTGTDDPVVPAALPGVMGAGAVDDCQAATNPPPAAGTVNPCSPDPTPTLALFSNFDPPTGNVDAQVGAPGVQLYSTFPGFGLIWATVSGTSFSAPVVAGEAALLVQLKQTGAANRNLIETSADGAVLGGPLGYGLVQVLGALRLAPAPSGGSGKGHHHKKH